MTDICADIKNINHRCLSNRYTIVFTLPNKQTLKRHDNICNSKPKYQTEFDVAKVSATHSSRVKSKGL